MQIIQAKNSLASPSSSPTYYRCLYHEKLWHTGMKFMKCSLSLYCEESKFKQNKKKETNNKKKEMKEGSYVSINQNV